MNKEFNEGETIVVLFAYHDCDLQDGSGRYAVDPFDTEPVYGTCLDNGSEDDNGNWGAEISLENGEECWLHQQFIVTARD